MTELILWLHRETNRMSLSFRSKNDNDLGYISTGNGPSGTGPEIYGNRKRGP